MNVIPADLNKRKEFSEKLDKLAAKVIAAESLKEDTEEGIEALTEIIKECSGLKAKEAKAKAKAMIAVRVDAAKVKQDEEEKVLKAQDKLAEYKELGEELSVLKPYQVDNLADEADKLLEVR